MGFRLCGRTELDTELAAAAAAVKRVPAPNLGKMVPGGKKPFGFQNCCNVTVNGSMKTYKTF